MRLRIDSAAKKVPLATRAQVPRTSEKPCLTLDMEVIEDQKDGREHELDDGDEEEVGEHLGQEQV